MYAVLKTGGKQYRALTGGNLKVEKISAGVGEKIEFRKILSIGSGEDILVGSPFLPDTIVKATIISHGKSEKVKIFKMRRRKHYQLRAGHRQQYTEIHIDSIETLLKS